MTRTELAVLAAAAVLLAAYKYASHLGDDDQPSSVHVSAAAEPPDSCRAQPGCLAGYQWAVANAINEKRHCPLSGGFARGCEMLVDDQDDAQMLDVPRSGTF